MTAKTDAADSKWTAMQRCDTMTSGCPTTIRWLFQATSTPLLRPTPRSSHEAQCDEYPAFLKNRLAACSWSLATRCSCRQRISCSNWPMSFFMEPKLVMFKVRTDKAFETWFASLHLDRREWGCHDKPTSRCEPRHCNCFTQLFSHLLSQGCRYAEGSTPQQSSAFCKGQQACSSSSSFFNQRLLEDTLSSSSPPTAIPLCTSCRLPQGSRGRWRNDSWYFCRCDYWCGLCCSLD